MAGVHAMMISGGGDDGSVGYGLYLKRNGVTIAAQSLAPKGTWHTFKGKDYYVAKDNADLVSVVNVYKGLTGSGEVLADLTRDGQTKSIPLNQVVTTFVDKFATGENGGGLFYSTITFNQSIDSWDTSNIINMHNLFMFCYAFNQDIRSWDTGNVTNMDLMFANCRAFVQDLSGWCVSKIPTKPDKFDTSTPTAWTEAMKPNWGAPC